MCYGIAWFLTSRIRTPLRFILLSTWGGAMVTPSAGLIIFPYSKICSTSPFTVSIGMANPTPIFVPFPLGSRRAVLIPMSCPRLLRSTPPRAQKCFGSIFLEPNCNFEDNCDRMIFYLTYWRSWKIIKYSYISRTTACQEKDPLHILDSPTPLWTT